MNSGPMLFLGLFASMAISWVTFVLGPQAQMGNLQPAKTVAPLPAVYPNTTPGLARQGAEVYRASGCAYCHTEQVRPAELARTWPAAGASGGAWRMTTYLTKRLCWARRGSGRTWPTRGCGWLPWRS